MNKPWKKYLLWFAQEHIEFRFEEIDSLLSMFQIKMRHFKEPDNTAPYWIVEFESESDLKRLVSRSVSIRSCMELWAHAKDIQSLHCQLQNFPKQLMEPYFQPHLSFKIEVETFCRHFSQKEKINKLESFSYLPVQGPVKLKDPDVCLHYIEYYGTRANDPPENPYDVFFGRWIANGLRQLIRKLSLKTRKFIGNTSMDPQLSLLMANQAQVKDGDIVLDPFVGSGSLLVAAAEFGGFVLGGDIDYLMLHARTRPSRIKQKERAADESIKANMEQYNLQHKYLDVLINDFASSFWRDDVEFDSIITDPPYGIREATERVGTSKENFTVSEKHLPTHIPAKIEYGISSIYNDLLKFAAKHLRLGGRLVCWFPVFREDYSEAGLPSHPCLKLVANSEQILTKITSRRLLTFEKVRNINPTDDSDQNKIVDFREKYYVAREETRKEKRMREARIRKENWIQSQKNNPI
ncbi:tRNA (guanine(10)-N2)-methyltransferase homolog [Tribolium castaneum]|uniref:tRNA (guanine(10)-N2)-methyltransferase homolog n=1 Tax=Tribolium castaneum TaxID=7070 RepID=UPI0000D555DD|nr:PREDICTED: tRNA (guanine(10)-N2)-methyltransferase homolog [Tribolium castaneum]|eukprot:XP_008201367.1 PREDICTED: tRNA (guanine(10)-N2)-methyltransferase homolog [Tribolium castaneum]